MPTPTNQFRLKLHPTLAYNFSIDWGDGSREIFQGTASSIESEAGITHTYTSEGLKRIAITENVVGGFPKTYFNAFRNTDANNDAVKVRNIRQWGRGKFSGFGYSFANCTNLQIGANDSSASTINQMTNFSNAFYNCIALTNFPLNFDDTANITNFNSTWYNCSNITNFPLLNMRKMTVGTNCFFNVKIPTETYTQLLIDLAANNLNTRVDFFAGLQTNYFPSAQDAKDLLTRPIAQGGREWTIQDGGAVNSLNFTKNGGTLTQRDALTFTTNPVGLNCGEGCTTRTETFGPNEIVTLDYSVQFPLRCRSANVFYTTSRSVEYTYAAGSGIFMIGNGILNTGDSIELQVSPDSGLILGGSPAGAPYQGGAGIIINYREIKIIMSSNIDVTATISCA